MGETDCGCTTRCSPKCSDPVRLKTMKDIITTLAAQFRAQRRNTRRYAALLLVLAMVTALFVNWQLHSEGIAVTADYQCGQEEHEHTADCYTKVLVCGYEEGQPEDWNATMPDDSMSIDDSFGVDADSDIAENSAEPEYIFVPHEHTDDCYQEVRELNCFQEEHEHTDDCFDPEDGSLICDLFEHTHDDSCYSISYELVCGLEDGELVEELNPDYVPVQFEEPVAAKPVVVSPVIEAPIHYHTDDCYEEVLTCGLEEHHHTVNCLADPLADVEDEADWLAKTNTALSGQWTDDLLTVAQSQLGYEQSEKNFELDAADGVTVRHYTRYGAWYGNPYGGWDVMFLSYCLNYAGVPQSVVPQRAGALALRSDLRGSEWLKDAVEVRLQPGDIVLYNTTSTETVAVQEEPQIEDLSADADTELLQALSDSASSEPQTEERTVTYETVGIVSSVDETTGTVTVISGNVDGKVAEVTLGTNELTGVIDLAAAYAAQSGEPAGSVEPASEGSSAVVVWTVSTASLDPRYLVATLESGAAGGKTLTNYIDNVTFEKEDKNKDWIPVEDELIDGQKVRVIVDFTLPQNTLSESDHTLTYQLPGGITLDEAEDNGTIRDGSGNAVGSYTIDKHGKMVLNFTDINYASSFNGKIYFEGKASYDTADDGKISFDDRFNMNIKKPDPTLSIKKEEVLGSGNKYTDENGNCYLGWRVTVSSEKGTYGETVTIADVLNNNSTTPSAFVKDSIVVYRRDAAGNLTLVDSSSYTPVLEPDGAIPSSEKQTVTISGLPALEAGEGYVLTYRTASDTKLFTNANGSGKFSNTATASSGNTETSITKDISFLQRITKKGELTADGLIKWTVTVSAPQYAYTSFLKDYRLRDPIPNGVEVQGDITLTATPGGQSTTLTRAQLEDENGYRLGDLTENAYTYTLTYYTTVPENGGTVVNTAYAKGNGREISATDKVSVSSGAWTLKKTRTGTQDSVADWNLDVSNPIGESSFVLTDTIGDTIENDTTALTGMHYAVASKVQSAIEQGLQLYTLGSTEPLSYAEAVQKGWLKVTYLDADGSSVSPADDTRQVMCIRFAVDTGSSGVLVRRLVVNLPTYEERSQTPDGAKWVFNNDAVLTLPNGSEYTDHADDAYHNYNLFQKEVSTDGGLTYQSGTTGVRYEDVAEVDGKATLFYRISLMATADQKGQIEFIDELPTNVTWTTGDKYNTLKVDGTKRPWSRGNWSLKATGSSKQRVLDITVSALTPGREYQIEFVYQVQIDSDPNWSEMIPEDAIYTNKVTLISTGQSVKTVTTVSKKANPLTKTAVQLKDEQGNWTNRVRYTIVINPKGETIGTTGKLLLEDAVTLESGKSIYADTASVKLYRYRDGYQPGDTTDTLEPLDRAYYQIMDPDADHWLRIEVQDGVPLVLEYVCELDPGSSSEPSMSNTITLNGIVRTLPTKLSQNKSNVSIMKGQFVLNKLDSASNQPLEGAQFSIQKYDQSSQSFVPVKTGTTGANGQLIFDVTDNDANTLDADVLYRIEEIAAPSKYILDSTPRYLLFYDEATNEDFDTAYRRATGTDGNLTVMTENGEETVLKTQVTGSLDTATLVLNIKNVYNELTVRKMWLDASTNLPLAENDERKVEVEVQLYRRMSGRTDEAVGEPVTLNKDNDWTYTWSGEDRIPAKIDNIDCYYYVVETTSGNWTVTDRGNEGVQKGEIYLYNNVHAYYELPSTGGMGTAPFAAVGGLLAAGATLLLTKRRKRNEMEGE